MPITEMIRTCPKCGDFYADASLAFCLVDGTPLVNVERTSELWKEGERVIEVKENVLRTQNRKLKWQRVLVRSMTIVIATMVVYVVVVNTIIYFGPKQPDETTSPAQQPKETPTVTPTKTVVATSTPDTPSVCSDADKNLAREFIINEFSEAWRRDIETERPDIIAVNVPAGAEKVEAALSPLGFESAFSDVCATASLTINYRWEVRFNLNGALKVVPVAKQKKFTCVKTGSAWRCS